MKLQFKYQPFQADAAMAVCDVFSGQPLQNKTSYRLDIGNINAVTDEETQQEMVLVDTGFRNHPLVPEMTNARILSNLKSVQGRNGLPRSEELIGPGINLSIEMETGTGKTYTYIKTIYELNRRYGWSKFIIIVPSVAIREGIHKSFLITQEHFANEYSQKIRFFVYNPDKIDKIDDFASDSAINVMIINMQAFNSSKNQNIIDKELDKFRSRRPIDIIAKTNPILIIDEPQSVEGKQTKESLQKFNPLFTLRYSATHKEKYNMVYRLDAMDAYNQHLVKKIAAMGITLTGTTATNTFLYFAGINISPNKPTANLVFDVKGAGGKHRQMLKKINEGDDLFALSGELEEYRDRYIVTKIIAKSDEEKVIFLNGLELSLGQVHGNEQMTDLQRRVQIRETIRVHLRRERELYPKGIKVLSLFFIDEVAKYRLYDGDNDDGRNGDYAKMFEEEYANVLSEMQLEIGDEKYLKYLDSIDPHRTHQGYFSIDKKKGKKARFVEGKIDSKTRMSDDAEAYDLIMKDKERLLSLDEPVRFIFSHSALREGWDNPNVFQICTLKPQSESEIRSRQEIGRGLRLCVNQKGERMDESVLGSEVQELNKLTLITDMEFGKFAEALQAGLADSLADRPKKVNRELFVDMMLEDEHGGKLKVTGDIADAIVEDLSNCGYISRGSFTDKYYEHRDSGILQVAEEVQAYAGSVLKILSSVYDGKDMQPENVYNNNVEAKVDNEKLKKKEFLNLWERINHKSFYTVSFDTDELVKNSITEIDSKLDVTRISVRTEYGEQANGIASKKQLEVGAGFKKVSTNQSVADRSMLGGVQYDLIGKIVEETGLTRATVAKILMGISPVKFGLFKVNPEEFIMKTSKLINNQKAEQIIEHIVYNKLDEAYDTSIFTNASLRGKLGYNAMAAEHSLFSHIIYDSEIERKFANELEVSEKVAVYVKLPGSFYISTPVGKYNPDWAIAFNEGEVKHVYFVAETKGKNGTLEFNELRGVEQAKIECAKAHFAAISNDTVHYDVIKSYDELLDIVTG